MLLLVVSSSSLITLFIFHLAISQEGIQNFLWNESRNVVSDDLEAMISSQCF